MKINTFNSLSGYGRWALVLVPALLLGGCDLDSFQVLSPSGPVSRTIDELFWITMALMTLVLIPVFGMTAWFIWKFRASNQQAHYAPHWDAAPWIEWLVWLFPSLIILILGTLTWIYTHRLDPYKPLAVDATTAPLEVQVVALDWKWLFIYPDQHIASLNQLVIPVNRPVSFKITSNTVMNSFFIPKLGGQIFAMAGMATQLHLLADKPGHYTGENTQYSGRGFPYQSFEVIAATANEFSTWVKSAQISTNRLDMERFEQLAKPSTRDPVSYYAGISPDLFQNILRQFDGAASPSVVSVSQ